MGTKELFKKCLEQTTKVIEQVKIGQFGDPTPDTDWDVKKLCAHILYELAWVEDVLAGKTIAEVGSKYDGDLIGNDLVKHWHEAEARAEKAVEDVDLDQTIHLSYGDFPAKHFITEQANDFLIHAWDLGSAIGVSIVFDPAVAEELYQASLPRKNELARTGLFAPVVKVEDSADTQTKLLAIFGRRNPWK